jgi:hypothetical protein
MPLYVMTHYELMNQSDTLLVIIARSLSWILRSFDFKVYVHLFTRKLNNFLKKGHSLALPKIKSQHLLKVKIKNVDSLFHIFEVMIDFTIVPAMKNDGDVILSKPDL